MVEPLNIQRFRRFYGHVPSCFSKQRIVHWCTLWIPEYGLSPDQSEKALR
jgi:hypothetical protein